MPSRSSCRASSITPPRLPAAPHQSVFSGSLPRTEELTPAPSNPSTLGREALVVPHDQLRFHLIDRVHRHANHNQQRRASEIELHAQAFQDEAWKMLVNRSSRLNSSHLGISYAVF